MNLLIIIGMAIGLAMDTTAVSIASGIYTKNHTSYAFAFKMASFFGFFHILMPVAGWYAGKSFSSLISTWDHWVAFLLLGYVGGKMLHESFSKDDVEISQDPSKGWFLLTLSIATSIDALAVGMSISMLKQDVWFPSIIIGIVTFLFSFVGVTFGKRIGSKWSKKATLIGGIILIGIGCKIIIEHLIA